VYYVMTMIEDQVGIQWNLHGPFETGEEMEIAIHDGDWYSCDSLQRLKVMNNELTQIEFYNSREEKTSWIDGPPTQNGYFWLQVDSNDEKFVAYIEDGKFLTPGSNIHWELDRIKKHQVVASYGD
jgi:hypothetical protein